MSTKFINLLGALLAVTACGNFNLGLDNEDQPIYNYGNETMEETIADLPLCGEISLTGMGTYASYTPGDSYWDGFRGVTLPIIEGSRKYRLIGVAEQGNSIDRAPQWVKASIDKNILTLTVAPYENMTRGTAVQSRMENLVIRTADKTLNYSVTQTSREDYVTELSDNRFNVVSQTGSLFKNQIGDGEFVFHYRTKSCTSGEIVPSTVTATGEFFYYAPEASSESAWKSQEFDKCYSISVGSIKNGTSNYGKITLTKKEGASISPAFNPMQIRILIKIGNETLPVNVTQWVN